MKGIESLKKQIELHKIKDKSARDSGDEELEQYYQKEIKAKEETLERKKELLDKQ